MDWRDICLALAGAIGAVTAVIHGVLLQKFMVRPLAALAATDRRISASTWRLVPILLHMSTVFWFLGGLALIAVAAGYLPQARLATSLAVGTTFLFGAVGNLWGTRGKHPGWMLMTAALALIGISLG